MNDIYKSEKYYSKNARGNVQIWSIEVVEHRLGAMTIVRTGELDGMLRNINKITSEGKNVGRSNYTSPYKQAVKEAKAKEKVKIKHGYKTLAGIGVDSELSLSFVLALSKTDADNNLKPMKAVKFKKDLMNYPCLLQPKINGLRNTYQLIANITTDMFSSKEPKLKLLSKEGHEYVLPHISTSIPISIFQSNNISFDGELYVHNEILSNIRRRCPLTNSNGTVSKNSLSSDPVKLYVYDLSIPDMNQLDRIKYKDELLLQCNDLYFNTNTKRYEVTKGDTKYSNIINVRSVLVHSDSEVYQYLEAALASYYEGVIVRDLDAEYMFGGRRVNMSKLKKSMEGEFKILDIIKKNEDSSRTYISFVLQNDTNDKTFECTPEGDETSRVEFLNNKEYYIGKMMSATYFERTINDLPFHAVGRIREEWDLDINDLNKED